MSGSLAALRLVRNQGIVFLAQGYNVRLSQIEDDLQGTADEIFTERDEFNEEEAIRLAEFNQEYCAAWLQWQKGERRPYSALLFLYYSAMGFAFMVKGPAGIVIPLAGVIFYHLWQHDKKWLSAMNPLAGSVIMLLIIMPWYTYIMSTVPNVMDVFKAETIQRFGEKAPHTQPDL